MVNTQQPDSNKSQSDKAGLQPQSFEAPAFSTQHQPSSGLDPLTAKTQGFLQGKVQGISVKYVI